MKTYADLIDRVGALRSRVDYDDRARVRAVMNGGAKGVQAVLNWDRPSAGPGSGKGASSLNGMVDLPTANIMHSGLERLAQKIGRAPTLKTDMIPVKDTDAARKKAEKRGRIVRAWDDIDRIEMQYPQIGRWLPGYGFTIHLIRERDFAGTTYPVAEMRDPFDVYPGMWGPNQQPTEVAIVRHMSRKLVKESYPQFGEMFDATEYRTRGSGVPVIGQTSGWEGNPHRPIEVVEYLCGDGTYVIIPEIERVVSLILNPLESGPAFVMTKKWSFDQLQSQYHHVFGLMAMLAKLNILGLIGVEEGTLREINIIGELVGNTYERGRGGTNLFEPGARVEKLPADQIQQTWQAVNVLERQFRTVAGYPVAEDGQSPNSFATGQGIKELGASVGENVREYQTAIKHSTELIDQKRLEWEEKLHASEKKKVYWMEAGSSFEETYTPSKAINGNYRTSRIYGAMATFDENSKIVAGLQLLQAKVFDRRTVQENLDGDGIVPSLINERIDQDMAKDMMLQGLGQRMAEKDPEAAKALSRIFNKPKDTGKILTELLDPEEQEGGPPGMDQMMAMAGGGGGGPEAMEAGPPPAVQTILSQMEAQGGGVQSVGQMG